MALLVFALIKGNMRSFADGLLDHGRNCLRFFEINFRGTGVKQELSV
jgi:hypothetical protein